MFKYNSHAVSYVNSCAIVLWLACINKACSQIHLLLRYMSMALTTKCMEFDVKWILLKPPVQYLLFCLGFFLLNYLYKVLVYRKTEILLNNISNNNNLSWKKKHCKRICFLFKIFITEKILISQYTRLTRYMYLLTITRTCFALMKKHRYE